LVVRRKLDENSTRAVLREQLVNVTDVKRRDTTSDAVT
jgi:hypothetical protein